MFGLSFGELAIIAILALLLLGPDRLPDAAKTLAKGLRELRKATDDLKDQLGNELTVVEDVKRTVTDALAGAVAEATAEKPAAALPPRGPPPSADAGNVPGLEAALVEAAPQVTEPAAPPPTSAPGGGKP
jgi:sec-independent protein translocase protein TatB